MLDQQDGGGGHHGREEQDVVVALVGREIPSEDGELGPVGGDAGRRGPEHELLRVHEPLEQHAEPVRREREVDARETHGEPAEEDGAEASDDRRQHEGAEHRHAERLQRERGAIRPKAKVSGMAEGVHAARSHDEMKARGEQHRDEYIGAKHERVGRSLGQQGQQE